MTVGDPRKAVVLAVIALVVVCAAVYRALPSAPKPAPAPPASSTDSATDADSRGKDLAEAVSIDPFSHPDLDPQAGPAQEDPAEEELPAPPKPKADPLKQRPQTQPTTEVFGQLPPVDPMDAGMKESNAIRFSVEAIVRGDESLALVSIAGHSNVAVRVGTVLNGHVTVKAIKQGSVVIEVSGKSLEITVGDGVTLP